MPPGGGLFDRLRRYRPNEVIGSRYLHRFHIRTKTAADRSRWYLHRFLGSDGRVMHDHPWPSVSICLWGFMREYDKTGVRWVYPGRIRIRGADYMHRLELVSRSAWSIFITGKKIREWGFDCDGKWVIWREFRSRGGC